MSRLQRLALAMLAWCAACSCEPVPDLGDNLHFCLIGSECPDGTCVFAAFDPDACCGFGGDCLPCEGNWLAIQCPDGTCVGAEGPDACCAHGGACDPGDPPQRESATEDTTTSAESSSTTESSSSTTESGGSSESSGTAATGTAGSG
jgi:hypothetical protein